MIKIKLKHGELILDKDVYTALNILNFKYHTKDKGNAYIMAMLRMGYNNFNRTVLEMPLHRFLMGNPKGYDIDHINRNPLDNRKGNLRIATKQLNSMNTGRRKGTSIYKGVSWRRAIKKWGCYLTHNGKQIFLGEFNCPHDAAIMYNEKSFALCGEFAFQNVVDRSKDGRSQYFESLVNEPN